MERALLGYHGRHMGHGGAAMVSRPWGRGEALVVVAGALLLVLLPLLLLLLLPLLVVDRLLVGPLQEGDELFLLEVEGVGDSSEAEE